MTSDDFSNHPLHAMLRKILGLRNFPEFQSPDLDRDSRYALDKVIAIAGVVLDRLQATNHMLMSIHGLNLLLGQFQTIYDDVSSFQSNGNTGHLQSALQSIDKGIFSLSWAMPWSEDNDASRRTVSVALSSLEESANKSLEQLVKQRSALQAELAQVSDDATRLKEEVKETGRVVEQQRASTTIATADLNNKYAEWQNEANNGIGVLFKRIESQTEESARHLEARAAVVLDDLNAKLQEAKKIVQVVGNVGITGNYQRVAIEEARQADNWRLLTLTVLGAGLVVAGLSFHKFYTEDLKPDSLLTMVIRLLFALAITAPAIYTARESARHRTNADRARQAELELASLGPFIELMPEEKKVAIREELTKKYFGQQVEAHTVDSAVPAKELISLLSDAIKSLKKS